MIITSANINKVIDDRQDIYNQLLAIRFEAVIDYALMNAIHDILNNWDDECTATLEINQRQARYFWWNQIHIVQILNARGEHQCYYMSSCSIIDESLNPNKNAYIRA